MPFLRFFRGTRALRDPALARLVEQLARAPRIESERVGEGGEPSDIHAVFRQVADRASREQALLLLRHDSPVVRGYLAGHVLAAFPDDLEAVYPLLSDETAVEEQDGCCYGRTTVAQVVLASLRDYLDRPSVGQLLLRAALDTDLGELRGELVQILARRHPDEATAVARTLLREDGPKVLEGAIRALALAEDDEAIAEVADFAASPHDRIRAAVATTLGARGGPGAEPTLRQLATDSDPDVRMMAGDGYVRQPERDLALVRELLRDPLPRVASYTRRGPR